ncbi:MAG: MFS transporter [Rhodospirillales bacterium]|jgi:MFS family permease|nr:MFS transporter [Rhodospirillales bacterium]
MDINTERRNVLVLASCQGFSVTGMVMVTIIISLAGQVLADNPAYATLPMAVQMTATMLFATPASMIMAKVGRRAGFTIGQFIGILGGLIGAYALLYAKSFELLCLSGFLIGAHQGFWQLSRFAIADATEASYRPRAISYVLAGGILAALIGPELAKLSVGLFSPVLYAGTYLAYCCMNVLNIIFLQFLAIAKPPENWNFRGGRPLLEIARQPAFLIALMSGMVGYGIMVLVMTATPLSMQSCGFEFNDSAFVIQWHAFFMFAPGFITGHLIKRFGMTAIIMTGAFLALISMAVSLSGITLMHFWTGLVLMGVGWNFMFVGGTSLLTETYAPQERAKVQAFNDTMVFGTTAIASFGSGALLSWLGWNAVNLTVAAPAILLLIAAFVLRMKRHATTS